ncbi:MAG: VCBS repeat-containing protein [Luteolibacter sp.]|uniref:FG-GAP repeat domain-containing protein n=1 Tax=Luteolibacter sp. TaxID=1962973 RepID=UPI003266AE30
MKTRVSVVSLCLIAISSAAPADAPWKKQVVTTDFLTEGLSVGDLDGDGVKDLVAGAFWFKGPSFKERKQFTEGKAQPPTVYQEDSFLSWVEDFNGDGRNDILMASHPGKNLTLFLNPGKDGIWPAHVVMTEAATECPYWIDIDGDRKKEFVCMQGGKFGYAVPDWKDVTKPWNFVAISEKRTDTPYIHGLGVGDLNGDGRMDILEKDGWFEQLATKDTGWTWHKEPFAGQGGSQMLVFDADGDGDNDVITSLNAHGYGLAWYENVKKDGNVTFTRHDILPEDPAKTGEGGLQLSQLHSLASADFDGDGRMDFVTGKRYFAHNEHDPGSLDPALTVIFYNRKDGKSVHWQASVIDSDTGIGCQVQAVDLNGNGKPDVAVGSKKGVQLITR